MVEKPKDLPPVFDSGVISVPANALIDISIVSGAIEVTMGTSRVGADKDGKLEVQAVITCRFRMDGSAAEALVVALNQQLEAARGPKGNAH